ncbi:MAG: polysaccharide deacetylase family protein [Stappiaceae bacterium]
MAGVKSNLIKAAIQVLHMGGLCRLGSGFTGGMGVVFTLHRVRRPVNDAFQPNAHLEITPAFLDRAISRIHQNGLEIVSLDDLIEHLQSGRRDRRVAAITLDDGYLDNFDQAYPIFKKQEVPFTVFTMSGFIDREVAPWWIVLEDLIRQNNSISLDHPVRRHTYACDSLHGKVESYQTLVSSLTTDFSETQQREVINTLAERYEYDAVDLCNSIAMSWDHIRQLTQDPISTVGGHTHAHHALARLSDKEVRHEIDKGLDRIEEETGVRSRHFAFPYGYPSAISENVGNIIKQAGLVSAYTTRPGMLNASQAQWPYLIPRISLNGYQQSLKMIDLFSSGLPTAPLGTVNKLRGRRAN